MTIIDIPAVSTAKAFNALSESSEWGLTLRKVDKGWRLVDSDDSFIFESPQELWAATFAMVHAKMSTLVPANDA